MIVSTISEKVDKSDADSISSVTVKDEPGMTLSRAYSVTSEPPAYKKPTSSSVRIARLIAVTVVAVALILGTAIIVAAYLQTRHNNAAHPAAAPASSTETNKAVTASLPSALTGDAPNGIGEPSSSESSSEVADDDKDHRRLDTDGDLLEEFLENEGKILRLPTGGDLDIDIDELTKMFMKRNPLDKSKCVVERRPIDGQDDFVKVLPITSKNATAVPLIPFVTGERISIICSTDDDDTSADEDDGLIRSRPIVMPFGMRPPIRFNSLQGMPPNLNSMSVIGPIPFMMNPGQIMPSRVSFRPQLPLNLTPPPPFNNNNMMEQRNFNLPQMPPRSPMFQGFPSGQPFRLPEPFNRQQFGPGMSRPNLFPTQFQPFQQRPFPDMIHNNNNNMAGEKRFNIPSEVVSDNSQEKSHVPDHRIHAEPELPSTLRTPIFRERQPIPDFPEGLLSLLEDLPDILAAPEQNHQPTERLSTPPGQPNMPVFRIPKLLLNNNTPPRRDNVAQSDIPSGPVQLPARPVTLPFLQVPPFPAALARERSAPIPVNIPSSLNIPVNPPQTPQTAPDRRQGRTSFFERLMDSILSTGKGTPSKIEKSSDSMPVEAIVIPPVRTGGRGLRMPEDGIIVARPIESDLEPAAPEDRRARSHFIQPRSLKVN